MYDLISFNNKHHKQNIWKTQCWNNNLTKAPQLEQPLFTQWQTWYHYLCTLIKQERGSFERRVLNSKSQTCGSLWLCFLFTCLWLKQHLPLALAVVLMCSAITAAGLGHPAEVIWDVPVLSAVFSAKIQPLRDGKGNTECQPKSRCLSSNRV